MNGKGEEGEGKTPDFFSDVSDPPVVGYILRMQRTHLIRSACCCGLHFIRIHRTVMGHISRMRTVHLTHLWHMISVTFLGCGRASKLRLWLFISECNTFILRDCICDTFAFSKKRGYCASIVYLNHSSRYLSITDKMAWVILPKSIPWPIWGLLLWLRGLISKWDPSFWWWCSSWHWSRWWISRWYVRSGQNLNRSPLWSAQSALPYSAVFSRAGSAIPIFVMPRYYSL